MKHTKYSLVTRIIRTTAGWNKKLFQCFGCSKGSYSQCKKPVAEIRAPARRRDSCFERSSYFSSCGSFFCFIHRSCAKCLGYGDFCPRYLLPVAPGRFCSLPLTLFIGTHVSAILIHAVVANKQVEHFRAVEMIVALAMRSTLHVRAMMQSNDLKKKILKGRRVAMFCIIFQNSNQKFVVHGWCCPPFRTCPHSLGPIQSQRAAATLLFNMLVGSGG